MHKTTEMKYFQRKHPQDKFGRKCKRTDRSDPIKIPVKELRPPPRHTINFDIDTDTDKPTHNYTLRACRKPEKVRLNPRPARSSAVNVNYSKMDVSSEQISPPIKHKPPHLMRYPSATVISAHKMMTGKIKSSAHKHPTDENDHNTEIWHETISDNIAEEYNNTNTDTPAVTKETTNSDNNLVSTNRNNDTTNTKDTTTNDNNCTKSDKSKPTNQPIEQTTVTDQAEAMTNTLSLQVTVLESYRMTEVSLVTTSSDPQHLENNETPEKTKNNTVTSTGSVPKNTPEIDTNTQPPDLLQGKTAMCDSMELQDPDLEENALLMPFDRPPDIPIEPRGLIPTQQVNPEMTQESKMNTPLPLEEEDDTDATEIIEVTKKDSAIDDQRKADDIKKANKKPKRNTKPTMEKTKRKKTLKSTQSEAEVNKNIQQDTKKDKKGKLITQGLF